MLLACATGLVGVLVLTAVLSGLIGRSASTSTAAPPPVIVSVATPTPASTSASGVPTAAQPAANILAQPSAAQQSADARRFAAAATQVPVARQWMEGFYPIYATAQSTFGVNWLLIASIHMQETAFSTAPSTYHGLNFAHCCGGPMQFNVTNGGRESPPRGIW